MSMDTNSLSRREFLSAMLAATAGAKAAQLEPAEPIIDIHQHTNYSDRSDEELIAHQKAMGVTTTVLLPAGKYYGLDARCGGNDTVYALAKKNKDFLFFSNEVPDLPDALKEIRRYLRRGAIGIGEQKFNVACDSVFIERVAELAGDYRVPVLLHIQHGRYNTGLENFHRILEKFPKTNFIGHAQTWWANIDKNHDQPVLYPKTKVTKGGITDRLLSDYPNMFGDMSAGSGLNALQRDEDHARWFIEKHQDKLLYGSDCDDRVGSGPKCQGAQTIAEIRRLSSSKAVERKLLYENAKKLLRL
jgi:predicted TIM-barrel fold metal-dependent hydrolase